MKRRPWLKEKKMNKHAREGENNRGKNAVMNCENSDPSTSVQMPIVMRASAQEHAEEGASKRKQLPWLKVTKRTKRTREGRMKSGK